MYRYFVGLGPDDAIPDDTTISYFRVKRMGGEVARQGKDRQKQFEALIATCRSLHQAALKERRLLKDKRFHREVTLLHRVIAERQDEIFNESGEKEQKEHEKKIVGKMINPSDPDMNWGAKSDKKFFAGYKIEPRQADLKNNHGLKRAGRGLSKYRLDREKRHEIAKMNEKIEHP